MRQAQSPLGASALPPEERLITGAAVCLGLNCAPGQPPCRRRWLTRPFKGMSGRPTARSNVRQRRTAGWPTARESHGHGAPAVVVGVTPHQGGQESCPQGEAASREDGREPPPLDKEEAGQVLAVFRWGGMRNADCRNRTDADHSQEWCASTGKPDARKAGMSGLAEGPTEKGRKIPRRRPTLLSGEGATATSFPLPDRNDGDGPMAPSS